MKKVFLIILGLFMILTACDDFLEPRMSNEFTKDMLYKQPQTIANLLFTGYGSLPATADSWSGSFLDCATDNAVDADVNARTSKMEEIEGNWTSRSSILDLWRNSYDRINHINMFLEMGLSDDITYFRSDPEKDQLYKDRLEGEAYFLRAYIQFDLLRRFAGIDESGQLLGFPIITETQSIAELDQLSRNTFNDCVDQILNDIGKALSGGLKDEWVATDIYNETIGDYNIGRPTNIACMALKSRVLLYAASPAYTQGLSDADVKTKYQSAAQAAYDVIEKIGTSLPDVYTSDISTDFYNNPDNDELIMRVLDGGTGGASDGMAVRNFPPATMLLGQGGCNPSQNLVDAFPMANGYPINHSNNMGYSDLSMYENRDQRFYSTVLYNGSIFKDVTLEMFEGGNCAIGATNVNENETTRTGYYLRKWLSPKANLVSSNYVKDYHYYPVFRKAEIFLNFAEAANKAYGPTGGSFGMNAVDAVKEVRRRAGIAAGDEDGYLTEMANNESSLETLIKNERRIELCFEGHRFFDVRRWKDNLSETITGVVVNNNEGEITLSRINVVNPVYKDYMYYGPIPNNEILKTDNITQNQGW